MTRPPPHPFPPVRIQILPAGTALHRCHAAAFAATAFNPGQGQPSRFAPFTDAGGRCVPTLYAATSRQAAAFETIFHDIDPAAAFKTVALQVVRARACSRIAPRRDLRLAALFEPDLNRWGVRRADLIDTPKSAYAATAQWARAIHAAEGAIDGLLWTSRPCDPERCVVLFGDRIDMSDLDCIDSLRVGNDAVLIMELRGYGRRAGIDLVT